MCQRVFPTTKKGGHRQLCCYGAAWFLVDHTGTIPVNPECQMWRDQSTASPLVNLVATYNSVVKVAGCTVSVLVSLKGGGQLWNTSFEDSIQNPRSSRLSVRH